MMMNLSFANKQKFTFLAMVVIVAVSTHFTYLWLNPQLISFRRAEQAYAAQEWRSAIKFYRRSLSEGLNRPPALLNLSRAYLQIHDNSNAIYWFTHYLLIKPEDVDVRRELAGVFMSIGEFQQAEDQYQIILNEEMKDKADVEK